MAPKKPEPSAASGAGINAARRIPFNSPVAPREGAPSGRPQPTVRAQAPGGQPEQTVKRSADAVRAALEAHAAHGDALRARVLELLQA